jgi:hypothetical protein
MMKDGLYKEMADIAIRRFQCLGALDILVIYQDLQNNNHVYNKSILKKF